MHTRCRSLFPTTLFAAAGVSISYNVASIALVSAVPPAAKSLAGGLVCVIVTLFSLSFLLNFFLFLITDQYRITDRLWFWIGHHITC